MSKNVAVITGAGRGLGKSIALDLATAGAQTVLAGRSLEHLERVEEEIKEAGGSAIVHVTDVTEADSVSGLFRQIDKQYGHLDLLVNNAGITAQANLLDLDVAEWQRIFDTNVRGMFLCAQEAGRRFAAVGRGRAVNVASVFGLLGRPGYSAYCASKGAVVNFTRAAAVEWARFGAQINAVAPGYFATDINASLREDEAAMAKVLRRIPAYRMGQPEELANVVTYLGLQAPDFLTGQTLAVDGGESSF